MEHVALTADEAYAFFECYNYVRFKFAEHTLDYWAMPDFWNEVFEALDELGYHLPGDALITGGIIDIIDYSGGAI